jgi:hypothetical protein
LIPTGTALRSDIQPEGNGLYQYKSQKRIADDEQFDILNPNTKYSSKMQLTGRDNDELTTTFSSVTH